MPQIEGGEPEQNGARDCGGEQAPLPLGRADGGDARALAARMRLSVARTDGRFVILGEWLWHDLPARIGPSVVNARSSGQPFRKNAAPVPAKSECKRISKLRAATPCRSDTPDDLQSNRGAERVVGQTPDRGG